MYSFFVFHLLTWITFFRNWSHLWRECWQGPKLFWLKILVSMICKGRHVSFVVLFSFFFFFVFFFYLPTKPENRQKIWAYPRRKAVYLVISCQYIFIVFSFFSLGMLWWTAVNLYSSCKLIVRKLYRFLYFGRKIFFFSVIKDFLSWHHIPCELCHYLIGVIGYSSESDSNES